MSTQSMSSFDFKDVQAVTFDLMGTCTDWKTSVVSAMTSNGNLCGVTTAKTRDRLARRWRAGFFEEIHRRFGLGLAAEDIDVTHRRVLDQVLLEEDESRNTKTSLDQSLTESDRESLVSSWHDQVGESRSCEERGHQSRRGSPKVRLSLVEGPELIWGLCEVLAWPDSVDAIDRLKKKLMVVVLANGTTRLQLDIVRSSGLNFHTLFSSQLLNLTKPSPEIYLKALSLLGVGPAQCVMVAAHAYDLRAAKSVGIKTIYVRRETEDEHEDMAALKKEFDLFLDGPHPLQRLADLFDSLPEATP